jgi:hypothetical protein
MIVAANHRVAYPPPLTPRKPAAARAVTSATPLKRRFVLPASCANTPSHTLLRRLALDETETRNSSFSSEA